MSLAEELRGIAGRRRKYILLRIINVSKDTALSISGVPRGTYNTWFRTGDSHFARLHQRVDEFSVTYRQEALQLLRKGNQLTAILLEEKLLNKMREELDAGVYDLIRTNLARAVYEKLLSSLDYQPQVLGLSWTQKLEQIFTNQPQLEGGVIDAEVLETTTSIQS